MFFFTLLSVVSKALKRALLLCGLNLAMGLQPCCSEGVEWGQAERAEGPVLRRGNSPCVSWGLSLLCSGCIQLGLCVPVKSPAHRIHYF